MNVISFSLWGDNPKYCVGAVKNVLLAKEYYPNWICKFYYNNSVPDKYLNTLLEEGAQLILVNEQASFISSLWRFYELDNHESEYIIFRDTDGRFTEIESLAVKQWMLSGKKFHIMRDHPAHYSKPIMAGMFGCKSGVLNSVKEQIEKYNKTNYYGIDEEFLANIIFPQIDTDEICLHDFNSFSPHINGKFVGQPFDANDNPLITL